MSAGELEERTFVAARRLQGAGLEPGQRLVLSGATSAAFVVAYAGALRAGLVVVPVNGAYTEREVARIVSDARPAGAVVEDSRLAGWISSRGIPVMDLDLRGRCGDASELDAARGEDTAL
jgi:long-chain acyl-CoA synthetase